MPSIDSNAVNVPSTFLRNYEWETNDRAITSFKVDQRDKPIRCNRESPSASFPVEKGPGPKERAEKPFPPWSLYIRHDWTHKFQKSKTSLAPMRIRGASESEQKDPWWIDVHVCMYACTCTEFLLAGSPMVTIATVQTRWPTASGFGWLRDVAAVRI